MRSRSSFGVSAKQKPATIIRLMISSLLLNYLFVLSVILIWFMIAYQFVLFLLGYWHSRWARQEQKELAERNLDLLPISVLVPARNEQRVIERTLRALTALSYPEFEVIVIDDGSRDETARVVELLSTQDPRIRLVQTPRERSGRGKATALNFGLRAARHEVIAVYDADNTPEPESLRYLAEQLAAHPECAAVLGMFRTRNRKRNLLTRFISLEGISFQRIVQAGRWVLLGVCTLPGTNYLIRRSVLEAVGGWDEKALTEDAELTLRVYHAGHRIKFVPYAVTWEQEPETLRAWFRQRHRWVVGHNYILRRYAASVQRFRPRVLALELVYSIGLYYIFLLAILVSDLLFLLCISNLVFIPVPGPYAQVWVLAIVLFVFEVLLAVSREPEENPLSNFPLVVLMYFTYCQLWIPVVLKSFYDDFILRREIGWVKTERFEVE